MDRQYKDDVIVFYFRIFIKNIRSISIVLIFADLHCRKHNVAGTSKVSDLVCFQVFFQEYLIVQEHCF